MKSSILVLSCFALLVLADVPVSIARLGAIVTSDEPLTSTGRDLLMTDSGGSSVAGTKVNGKWQICIEGNQQHFGQTESQRKHPRKPGGITVFADGHCVLDVYAGGFDGYWSADVGDGHESDMATAAMQMIDSDCRVDAGRRLHVNRLCNQFLQEMRDMADPENLDWPKDANVADRGVRQANIDKGSAACTAMITVHTDC